MVLEAAHSETNESQKDADHAKNLLHWVFFFEENQSVCKADDRASSSDRGDHGYHRIRIAQRQHIDIVRYD